MAFGIILMVLLFILTIFTIVMYRSIPVGGHEKALKRYTDFNAQLPSRVHSHKWGA